VVLVDGGRGSKDSGLLGPFSGGVTTSCCWLGWERQRFCVDATLLRLLLLRKDRMWVSGGSKRHGGVRDRSG